MTHELTVLEGTLIIAMVAYIIGTVARLDWLSTNATGSPLEGWIHGILWPLWAVYWVAVRTPRALLDLAVALFVTVPRVVTGPVRNRIEEGE